MRTSNSSERFLAIIALLSTCAMVRPQTVPPVEPEYVNQFFVLGGAGQLTPLEREPMHHELKHKDIPGIMVRLEGREDIDGGPVSPLKVSTTPHFIVKMFTGEVDPTTLMHLYQLKVDKKGRYYVTGGQQGVVFTNGKASGPQEVAAQLKVTRYGEHSLEVEPAQPLPPGEYALILNTSTADCFSVDPSVASAAPAAVQAASPAPAKIEPPTWKLKPVQHPEAITDFYEATLNGTAEAGGKRGAAQLDISCTVKRYTGGAAPGASSGAVLKVRKEMVNFLMSPENPYCEDDGAIGSPWLRSQVGSTQEQTWNLCFSGQPVSDPKAVLNFGLSIDEPMISSLFQASSELLTLNIRPHDGGADALATAFQLPANGNQVRRAFEPCLTMEEAKLKKDADAIVVACPALPEKKLTKVDVLVGTAMKKLPVDPDNDIGIAWRLPRATKVRPVAPKLTLACSYQDVTAMVPQPTPPKTLASTSTLKKMLPIPSTAAYCYFALNENTSIPFGDCSR